MWMHMAMICFGLINLTYLLKCRTLEAGCFYEIIKIYKKNNLLSFVLWYGVISMIESNCWILCRYQILIRSEVHIKYLDTQWLLKL